MDLYKRVLYGSLITFLLIMFGMMIEQVGFNAGTIILAPIFSMFALFPYVFPETLMGSKLANEKYGEYIQAVRNVERQRKLNSEF
jgi:hypothetical protein